MYRISVPSLALLFLALLTLGCGSSGGIGGYSISSSISGTSNPLVASYTIAPSKPGLVSVEFGTTTAYGLSTAQQHTPSGFLLTNLLVAGMKANTTYHMRARIEYDDGSTATDADRTFTTGSIPPGFFPSYTVTPTPGLTPQPGIEFVNTVSGGAGSTVFATDLDGNVIWYYAFPDRSSSSIYPMKLLPNGHMMCIIFPQSSLPGVSLPPNAQTEIREIDLAGNLIRHLTMQDLNARLAAANFSITLQLFHHDFTLLPNGHILVLANTLKSFTDLPGYPGATVVLGDVVVDLDPNFNPVWLWNEFDHFDVNRHPMQFPDWTHSNAVVYSPDDGNLLVSIRHQNWIVKVDYRDGAGTGNVIWRLGHQGDFKLLDAMHPTDWMYAQHDPNFISTNTTGSFQIAIMDNGDDRMFPRNVDCDTPGDPPCTYSTVPIMQVDENAKTASFLFHQVQPVNRYSSFAGSTRVLENGNIEYNLAGVGSDAYTDEVTPTDNPQTVWEMHIAGANTYRSYRMPSLYPGVQW